MSEELIPGYPKGSDITLINTIYLKPKAIGETSNGKTKWDNGYMIIIFRDNITGLKHQYTIPNPTYIYYMGNPDKYQHNVLFEKEENLQKIEVPYNNLEKDIAERTGNLQFYLDNIYNRCRENNKKLHKLPFIFNSDMNIEDNYRMRFSECYTNNIGHISKSYLDIEADIIDMKGDFPEPGECPINAVTVIFNDQNLVKTYLLRNPKNKLIEEFEKTVDENLYTELKLFIRDMVGGWKNEIRFGLDKYQYNISFYDDEIELIYRIFDDINSLKPDFLLAWNMGFDIPYIIERIKILGYDPADIMCNKDFMQRVARYWIDERNKNEYAERGDFATISSYTVFIDQMIHFASRRKGRSAFTSFSLDYIGNAIANVRKVNHDHISMSEFPYKDYKLFTFYNIGDTIAQKCIETKTEDTEYVFSKCNINNTRYSKCHRQTIYLINRATKEFKNKNNLIIGNNINKDNDFTGKFSGAFIADPTKLNDYSKIKIDGHPINVLNNAVDFDYSSLYPSLLREFNMAPNTQIGMIQIDNKVWDGENRRHDLNGYYRSGEFLENLQSRQYLLFCYRWLHLGSFMDVYHDIEEYFTTYKNSFRFIHSTTLDGKIIPTRFINIEKGITPIAFVNNDICINPVSFIKGIENEKILEVIDNARKLPKQSYDYNN